MSDDSQGDTSTVDRRAVLRGVSAGTVGVVGGATAVAGTARAASENDIWIVSSDDFDYPWYIADKMRDYAEEVFYDSSWTVHLDDGYDTSGAPTDSDGTYTKGCGDSSTYGLYNWWCDEPDYVSDADDCQLLMVPNDLYNGGCGGAKSAVAMAKRGLWNLSGPDSGDEIGLVGDGSDSNAYGEPAKTIARCLHEMGHTWGAAHADGHIWVTNSENRHSPLMLGDGQSNNCGYDVNHCGDCERRFLEGYADCESANIPHAVMDYDESQMENM